MLGMQEEEPDVHDALRAGKYPGVTSDKVDEANKEIQLLNADLRTHTKKRYLKTLEFLSMMNDALKHATLFIFRLDVIKSNHMTGKLYNHCRPAVSSCHGPRYLHTLGVCLLALRSAVLASTCLAGLGS